MKLGHFSLIAAVAAASVAIVFGQGPRRDGKWEVTMTMDMPGMPANMPPMTTTHCVTKEQASDPTKAVPQGRGSQPNDCKVSDHKVDGNKVTWTMKCESQGMTGSGEMVYAENAYTGTVKMDMGGRGMAIKYNAKRLGDCEE